MFRKKYRFKFEAAGGFGGYFWQTTDGKFIHYLVSSTINYYMPELNALKPGEQVEVEIKIKGRK